MAARFPQSSTAVAYRIKPEWVTKGILVIYWPATANTVHRLRPGDTTSTIISRTTATGASFNATEGTIQGTTTNNHYFTDGVSGGYGGLTESSAYSAGIAYYGDTFNGSLNRLGIGSLNHPDGFRNGFRVWFDGPSAKASIQGDDGTLTSATAGGIGDDALGRIHVALRYNSADSSKQRWWVNGAQVGTGNTATPSSSDLLGSDTRPLYFGGSQAVVGNTRVEFECAWLSTALTTDADMNFMTATPHDAIEATPSGTTLTLDPANFVLTGQSITFAAILAVDVAALALTGQDIALAATGNLTLTVDVVALALTGQDIAAQVVGTADPASLTLTGQDITLTATGGTTLVLDVAALALTGQDITLSATDSRTLALDVANLVLTGQDITVSTSNASAVSVDPASFSITGQDITLPAALSVDVAALTITGQDVPLILPSSIVVDTANLVFTGQDIALTKSFLVLDTASFTLTSQSLGMSVSVPGSANSRWRRDKRQSSLRMYKG